MASPAYRPEFEQQRGPSSVGKNVTITGQIYSREDLYIDGEIDGNIDLAEGKLTIGPNGRVKAAIHAREVVIMGSVQGNVETVERVDIRKDGKLLGDIRTARIVIEDGAVFKGNIDIVKSDPKQGQAPEAKPAPVKPQQSTATAGVNSAAASPAQQTLSEVKR